jgi:hypothetical protein
MDGYIYSYVHSSYIHICKHRDEARARQSGQLLWAADRREAAHRPQPEHVLTFKESSLNVDSVQRATNCGRERKKATLCSCRVLFLSLLFNDVVSIKITRRRR